MSSSASPTGDSQREERLDELLAVYLQAAESGTAPDAEAFIAEHADFADELREFFADQRRFAQAAARWQVPPSTHDAKPAEPSPRTSIEDVTLATPQMLNRNTGVPRLRYFGDYELVSEIARGGMGIVYKARQVNLKRIVALKMILVGRVANDEEVQRFHAEAKAAARLEHPNIVPIHEIGQHDGQHYFTMAFIDGESLAHRVAREVLPPREAGEIMRQVARAIAYAHVEGVIHRDLKPANILVDRGGRPHITDFGLAKRAGGDNYEATMAQMTATGQVLGTPSYMPPEQAEGKTHEIGPLADVYSLGAVLYCLISGRPPFQAASPLDTLLQVMHQDPVSPRTLNPAVPRDLETICMKCLQKDPHRRYASAQELADDLDRFLQDEPIRARPVGVVERSWRWLRKQKRSVGLTAAAVAATLVLVVTSIASWLWYQNWQLGYVQLNTDHPPLVAEVLDRDGKLATGPFTVPTQEPVAIPAGEYRLRLSAQNRMIQPYHLSVNRGTVNTAARYFLNLEDQLLGEVQTVQRSFDLITRGGRADILLYDDQGLHYPGWRDGGKPWHLELTKRDEPILKSAAPGLVWPWDTQSSFAEMVYRTFHPQAVEAAPDLDGDGIEDVVVAARHQAWIVAVSAQEGKLLWVAGRGADVLRERSTADQVPHDFRPSTVVGAPVVIGDQDGDQVPDLAALFLEEVTTEAAREVPRRWVEGISGRTGVKLWSFELDNAWFSAPDGSDLPYAPQWFSEVSGFSQSGGGMNMMFDEITRRSPEYRISGRSHAAPFPLEIVQIAGEAVVMTIAGGHIVGLQPESGELAWPPLSCGDAIITQPHLVDLDQDRQVELMLLQAKPSPAVGSVAATPYELNLSAWSLSQQTKLWQRVVPARWPDTKESRPRGMTWPLYADLDGDERPEIVVPRTTADFSRSDRAIAEIEVLDGNTGKTRWRRLLKTMDQQLDHFTVGPDINGDRHADIFVATMVGSEYELYVDALSGQDGQPLWFSSKRLGRRSEIYIEQLFWWEASDDGWPQLFVATSGHRFYRDTAFRLDVFSAGDGAWQGTVGEVQQVRFADGDGDDVHDLFLYEQTERYSPANGGRLQALRGVQRERWRRIGGEPVPGADYEGDGYPDLLYFLDPELAAVSGKNGTTLWKTSLDTSYSVQVLATDADLDGDGTPDVLVENATGPTSRVAHSKFPVMALSGRTGAKLWSVEMMFGAIEGMFFVQARDLDGDSLPEVIFSTFTDWDYPPVMSGTNRTQHWLAVVSGQTGAFRWRRPLSMAYGLPGAPVRQYQVQHADLHPTYIDADQDGTQDLLMPVETPTNPNRFDLAAVSGKDGSILWRRPIPEDGDPSDRLRNYVPPVIADVDQDGQPDIVGLEYEEFSTEAFASKRVAAVYALNARDGSEKWSWRTQVDRLCGRADSDPVRRENRPRPMIVRRDRGAPQVCVGLWQWIGEGQLVLIDHAGKLVAEWTVRPTDYAAFRPWVTDLDADGNDDICVVSAGKLLSYQTGESPVQSLEWTIPEGYNRRIVSVLPGEGTERTIIAVQSGATLYGVSGKDGQPVWINVGPQARTVSSGSPWTRVVSVAHAGQPSSPTAVFQFGNQLTAARLGRSANPQTRSIPLLSKDAPLPIHRLAATDPRWLRSPPWSTDMAERLQQAFAILISVGVALLMVILPGGCLYRMVTAGRWTLRLFLLLPVLAGMWIVVLRMPLPERVEPMSSNPLLSRAMLAAVGAPLILFVGLLTRLAWNRRWLHLTVWLAASVVIGATAAAVGILLGPIELLPEERYQLTDMDVPLAVGFFLAACLASALMVLTAAWRGIVHASGWLFRQKLPARTPS